MQARPQHTTEMLQLVNSGLLQSSQELCTSQQCCSSAACACSQHDQLTTTSKPIMHTSMLQRTHLASAPEGPGFQPCVCCSQQQTAGIRANTRHAKGLLSIHCTLWYPAYRLTSCTSIHQACASLPGLYGVCSVTPTGRTPISCIHVCIIPAITPFTVPAVSRQLVHGQRPQEPQQACSCPGQHGTAHSRKITRQLGLRQVIFITYPLAERRPDSSCACALHGMQTTGACCHYSATALILNITGFHLLYMHGAGESRCKVRCAALVAARLAWSATGKPRLFPLTIS